MSESDLPSIEPVDHKGLPTQSTSLPNNPTNIIQELVFIPRKGILGHATLVVIVTIIIMLALGGINEAIPIFILSNLISPTGIIFITWRWHTSSELNSNNRINHLLFTTVAGSALATVMGLFFLDTLNNKDFSVDSFAEHISDSLFFFVLTLIINFVAFFGPSLFINPLLGNHRAAALVRYFVFATAINTCTELTGPRLQSANLHQLLPDIPLSRLAAIEDLRARGRRLRIVNAGLLVLVLFILVSSAVFVIFAGQIAGKDTQSLDSLVTLRMSLDNQEDAVRRLEDERVDLSSAIRKAKLAIASPNSTNKERREAEADITQLEERNNVVTERISRAAIELQRRSDLYGKLEQATTLDRTGTGDEKATTNLLLAAGITRFGVLAISIYLVQILIGLYRYNAQVAAHYFTQADTLLLVGHSATEIGDLVSKLKLTVGFGKTETSIPERTLDKISELLKAASDRLGKQSSADTSK